MATKSFTGTGYNPSAARKNADDQVDDFIQDEKQAGKNIVEDDRIQEGTPQTASYYYCQLKLKYHYD